MMEYYIIRFIYTIIIPYIFVFLSLLAICLEIVDVC